MRHRLGRIAIAARWPVVALAFGLGILGAVGLSRLRTDNSPQQYFPTSSPRLTAQQRVESAFGVERLLRVSLSGPGVTTSAGLAWVGEVLEEIREVPGVASASGPPDLVPGWAAAVGEPERLVEALARSSLARSAGWSTAGGEELTLLVVTDPGARIDEVASHLEDLVADPPEGVAAGLVGLPLLDQALSRSSEEIGRRFVPFLVLVTALLVFGVTRSWADTSICLAPVLLTLVVVLGGLGVLDIPLNLVLTVLPPVLYVIVLATTVHLVLRVRDLEASGLERRRAVAVGLRDKRAPILWTAASTAAGFASLALAPVPPIRTLGTAAAVGIALGAALTLLFVPALLSFGASGGGSAPALRARLARFGSSLAGAAAHRQRATLALAAVLAVLALAGLPRLRVESDALTYLAPGHSLVTSIRGLEENGVASASVEVMVRDPACDLDTAAGLAALDRLTSELEEDRAVLGAVSAGDLAAAVPGAAPGIGAPGELDLAGRLALLRAGGRGELVARMIDAEGCRARLSVGTVIGGYPAFDRLEEGVREATRAVFPSFELTVAGEYVLLLESQRRLLGTLVTSLAVTGAVVAVMFLVLAGGDPRLAAVAMLPNLWPVVGVFGIMGWAGIPLDIATVMVAAVALSLAVDDTIHTLVLYRRRLPREGPLEAIRSTLEVTAPAYLLTGAVLAAGFGVCATSSFAPTARFGLTAAIAIVLAVVGDLVVTPALLVGRGAGSAAVRRRS